LQNQVFHVLRQPQVSGRKHSIGALVGVLDHHVAGIVDVVGVVARAADHDVGAGAAIEDIAAAVVVDAVAMARGSLSCALSAATTRASIGASLWVLALGQLPPSLRRPQ
jgi:hypothetical protein